MENPFSHEYQYIGGGGGVRLRAGLKALFHTGRKSALRIICASSMQITPLESPSAMWR